MSSINKFCRTLVILINKFKSQKNITLESIIDFAFELLFEEHLSNKNEKIQKFLIDELIESSKKVRDLGEEQYYFEKSESLKRFMESTKDFFYWEKFIRSKDKDEEKLMKFMERETDQEELKYNFKYEIKS